MDGQGLNYRLNVFFFCNIMADPRNGGPKPLVRGAGNMRGLKVRDETINGCRGVAGVSSHFA